MSIAALLGSSYESLAPGDSDGDDVVCRFSLHGKSISGCKNDQPVSTTFRGTEWSDDIGEEKISALDKPPEFEPNDIYGITSGGFEHQEGNWKTTIKLKGDFCVYEATHPSGHFKKIVWKKGVGLVEYANGYGARADGYRLKRVAAK